MHKKMKIIPQIVFEKLQLKKSCNLIGEEHFGLKLETRFFPEMQFSQNDIANYGALLKAQKVMLPLLKSKIFCFWSKFVSFTQLSRQQI